MDEIKEDYEKVHKLRKSLWDFRRDNERKRQRVLLVWYCVKYSMTPVFALVFFILNIVVPKSLTTEYACDLSKRRDVSVSSLPLVLRHRFTCTNDSSSFTIGIIAAFNICLSLYIVVLLRGALWIYTTGRKKFPKAGRAKMEDAKKIRNRAPSPGGTILGWLCPGRRNKKVYAYNFYIIYPYSLVITVKTSNTLFGFFYNPEYRFRF